MKPQDYYTSGEFAKMAHITVRTVRYYDKQNILKPSYVNESGARFYSDSDFVRLQQILLLKYLGFSLEDIRELIVGDTDYHMLQNSLNLQLKLVKDQIEQMQMVAKAIEDTAKIIETEQDIDWTQMMNLIHLTNMENTLKSQYQNATNISARINLHRLYSINETGWFPFIYDFCEIKENMHVLEIGCGNGAFWMENKEKLPKDIQIILNDISEGMLRDARREMGQEDSRFTYDAFDCHAIPYADESFELVIANHVLFYVCSLADVLKEVCRVLKPGGRLVCSTYGAAHMHEISELVEEFDARIVLSADKLYQNFGMENGTALLQPYFEKVKVHYYEDALVVDKPEPLIEYILSCHGNQNQYILNRYPEFRAFVEKKMKDKFTITKESGIFVAEKCK